jgi:tetratricopeptide (TPR) repeat protein
LRIFSITSVPKRIYILLCLLLLIIGCSLEKKSNFNRHMQDLTTHYNILFNANQILQQKQDDYALSFIDSYNEILNVYQDTTAKSSSLDKDLQTAVDKANKIIAIKEQSHYLGDAYLVLGKANFLGGQYFNANEYFTYVLQTFPKQKDIIRQARVWKARTLMYLNKLPLAKLQLDTVMADINPKKVNPADIYATKLQYDIDMQDYTDGEDMAKLAIQYCKNKNQRLRWTFILAQIEELNQKNSDAYANYVKIAKSNAAFEMAFNADLNRIRIEDAQNGVKLSRIDKLKSLLKNPNNKEFNDQIYYQVAQLYFAGKDIDNAIKNYKLSVATSVKNQNQKGLSYLRIADINFNIKANYITAKKYYDSTLTTLTPNYPGYSIIQKKTNNLQLLTDRLLIISREDTLQMLARMDEKARNALIDTMVNRQILQQAAQANAVMVRKSSGNINSPGNVINTGGNSTFYFYNSQAVSQGYNDFKRLWGSRKLEDDWRRSSRSGPAAQNTINGSGATDPTAANDPTAKAVQAVTAGRYRQQIVQNLPLTPALVDQSNLRIYNAYFDIAGFYRDILGDKRGAIDVFETILRRFPDNPNLPAIYYSLYRLYTELNDPKADEYKNKLLKNYAETPFAKIIIDPDYSKKLGDKDAEFKTSYNQVFDLYDKKKYTDAVASADLVIKQYPDSKYLAQLYYLRAIAAGHNEPVAAFKKELEQIAKNYPNDRLIIPLITEHINYINANLVDMSARHNALLESDTSEVPFTPPVENKKETEFRYAGRAMKFATVADIRKPEPKTGAAVAKVDSAKAAKPAVDPLLSNATPAKKPVASSIFSMKDSTNYYFIINIYKDNTNLAPSRFGIGQFNRTNLTDPNVKHQLMDVGNDNRLIFVGRFYNLASVKAYARAIIPLMPEIMTLPKDKYAFFIITSQNLDKLKNKKLLDSYIDFYQNNY